MVGVGRREPEMWPVLDGWPPYWVRCCRGSAACVAWLAWVGSVRGVVGVGRGVCGVGGQC